EAVADAHAREEHLRDDGIGGRRGQGSGGDRGGVVGDVVPVEAACAEEVSAPAGKAGDGEGARSDAGGGGGEDHAGGGGGGGGVRLMAMGAPDKAVVDAHAG